MDISTVSAVVTGGASGLGEATCRRLLQLGARGVTVVDRDEARGRALASELGKRCCFVCADITDAHALEAACRTAVDRFGAIHVLVCAAGIAGPGKLIAREPIPMERFDEVIKINLYGTVHALRAAVPCMLRNPPTNDGERGVAVMVSSGAAFEGQVGQVGYSASKAALVGMTLPLARELGEHGIRVVTVAPGGFDTPLLATVPQPVLSSIAAACVFPKRMGRTAEFGLFIEELVRNPMHNGRTYRFDAGMILPAHW